MFYTRQVFFLKGTDGSVETYWRRLGCRRTRRRGWRLGSCWNTLALGAWRSHLCGKLWHLCQRTRLERREGCRIGVVLYLQAKQVGLVQLNAESFTPVRTRQPSLLIASRMGQNVGQDRKHQIKRKANYCMRMRWKKHIMLCLQCKTCVVFFNSCRHVYDFE